MNVPRRIETSQETRRRAADIRRCWSPIERQKRAGLPPDTPWSLIRALFAPPLRIPALDRCVPYPGQLLPAPATSKQ